MKKLLLSLTLVVITTIGSINIYSQSLGIGLGYNTSKQYQIDLKCYTKDYIILMLDVDFTGRTNPCQTKFYQPSEITNDVIVKNKLLNSTTINIGIGGSYYNQWYIVGLVGFNTKDYYDLNKTKNTCTNITYKKSFNVGVEYGYFIIPAIIISANVNLIGNAGIKLGINL